MRGRNGQLQKEEDLSPFFCVGGGFGLPHINGRCPGEEAEEIGGTLSKDHQHRATGRREPVGELRAVQFHPSTQVPMLLVASADRRLGLFNVHIYPASHPSNPTSLNRSMVTRASHTNHRQAVDQHERQSSNLFVLLHLRDARSSWPKGIHSPVDWKSDASGSPVIGSV